MTTTTTPQQRIAAQIRTARLSAGLSQEKLARQLGVTVKTIGRWERCETTGFVGQIASIAEALNTTPDELLTGPPPGGEDRLDELASKLDQALSEIRRLRDDLHS